MEYFTSDTHFFHEELLQSNNFAPRPFNFLEDEHPAMIKAWNDRVGETDTVYHLGDIAMVNHIRPANKLGHEMIAGILEQLNGHIVIIKGNHDSRALFKYLAAHNPVLSDGKPKYEFRMLVVYYANHHQFFLTHYPMMFGQTPSSINLHVEIHHYSVPVQENINVGVIVLVWIT